MKTRNKKGFTIVELVIVIAVIGILTAILVPVFINLTNKANEASDNSLVKNLNTALRMEEQTAGHKKAPTLQGAIDDLENQGYLLENLQSKSGLDLLWDQEDNQFLLNKEGVSGAKYWKIVDTLPELDQQVYSYYAGQHFSANAVANIKYGFDVGDNEDISSISYINETTEARNVSIRTNGGTLNINAPLDVVKQYGDADSVKVEAIKTSSLHVYGTIKYAEISIGRIAMENGSKVDHIHVNAKETTAEIPTEFNEVIIAKATGVEMPNLSRDDVEINATTGTLVVALQEGTEEVTPTTELDYVWLTKQGIYEQITVSSSKTDKGSTWVDTSDKSAETKDAAKQIANNIGRNEEGQVAETTTVDEKEYNVTVDPTTREIVVKDAETGATASAEVAEKAKEQTVEAQPDKADVETGAVLFAGGAGTKSNPWYIIDQETFQHVGDFYNSEDTSKYYYWEVRNDVTTIDMTGWSTINLQGSIKGNGVALNNLTAPLFEAGARTEQALVVENMSIEANIVRPGGWVAVVFRSSPGKNVLIDNVDVSGYIEGESVATYMIQNWASMNAEIRDSESTITMFGSGACGGMTGYIGAGSQTSTLNVVDSRYTGTMIRSANNNFTYFGFNNNGSATISITLDEESCSSDFTMLDNTPEAKTYTGTWAQIAAGHNSYVNADKKVVGSLTVSINENNKVVAAKGASTRAVATLMVGPNPGNMYAGYYSEELVLDGSNWVSDKLVQFTITCDNNSPIGISNDGQSFNVHGEDGNIHIAHILVTEYDSQGNVINVGKYTIPASYYPNGQAY